MSTLYFQKTSGGYFTLLNLNGSGGFNNSITDNENVI